MRPGSASSRSFASSQTARIIGITYRQLDYWARTNLVRPSLAVARGSATRRRYSYRDLLKLGVIKALLDSGIRLQLIRDVFVPVEKQLERGVAEANLVIQGTSVTLHRDPDSIAELLRAQPTNLKVLPLAEIKDELDLRIRTVTTLEAMRREYFPTVEQSWENLVATAYHEAGHAVAARVLGIPVARLTIKPSGTTRTLGGVSRPVLGNENPQTDRRLSLAAWRKRRRDARHDLLVSLAGPLAEWKKCGTSTGNGWDLARASALLQFLHSELRPNSARPDGPPSGTDNTEMAHGVHWDRAWTESRALLARSGVWEWIEAVAEAALTYETLDGDQIDALNPSRQTDDGSEPKHAPTGRLPSPDLAGADRAGADLFGKNLANHNLTGANLAGANLNMANLRGAYLFGADLTSATLVGADLTEANFEWSTLKGAALDNAVLRRAELTRANLAGADLCKADLTEANLCGANLKGAQIEAISLSGAVADMNTVWPDGFNPTEAGVAIITL